MRAAWFWCLSLAACRHSPQALDVTIDSSPQAAAVSVDAVPVGKTPLRASVRAHARVWVDLEGYEPDLWVVEPDDKSHRFALVPSVESLALEHLSYCSDSRNRALALLDEYVNLSPWCSDACRCLAAKTRVLASEAPPSLAQSLGLLAERTEVVGNKLRRFAESDLRVVGHIVLTRDLALRIALALGYPDYVDSKAAVPQR